MGHYLKAVQLGVGFFCVFLAFTGTQSIMSSVLPDSLGYWSLGCIYLAMMFGSFFLSSGATILLTPKWAMFLGSLFYAVFEFCNLWPKWGVIIPASVILGFAASILWTSEAAYLASVAVLHAAEERKPRKATIGLFTGIFMGIYLTSAAVGNVITSLVLTNTETAEGGVDTKLLFYVFTGVAALGCVIVGLLPRPKPKPGFERAIATESAGLSVKQKFLGALVHLKNPKMLILIVPLLAAGFLHAFVAGDFTKTMISEVHGVQMVGYIYAVIGVFNAVTGPALGELADKFGARWIYIVGYAVTALFLVTMIPMYGTEASKSYVALVFWAALLGIGETALYSLLAPDIVGIMFTDQRETAFATVKIFQSGGTSLMFFLGGYIPYKVKLIILSVGSLLGLGCLLFLDLRMYHFSAVKKEKADDEIELASRQVESPAPKEDISRT